MPRVPRRAGVVARLDVIAGVSLRSFGLVDCRFASGDGIEELLACGGVTFTLLDLSVDMSDRLVFGVLVGGGGASGVDRPRSVKQTVQELIGCLFLRAHVPTQLAHTTPTQIHRSAP